MSVPTTDTPAERDCKATALAHDLRRFKRITYVLYAVAVGLAIYVAVLNGNVREAVQTIQHERARNTLAACKVANREHAAIRSFVLGTIPPERLKGPTVRAYFDAVAKGEPVPRVLIERSQVVMYLDRARTTFPERDCQRELAQKVKGAG